MLWRGIGGTQQTEPRRMSIGIDIDRVRPHAVHNHQGLLGKNGAQALKQILLPKHRFQELAESEPT